MNSSKNIIIIALIFALGISLYFSIQNKEIIKTETGVKPPSQSLKNAFKDSVQHSAMADIAEFSCFPTSRYDCDLEGCEPVAPATYYFIDYGTES